MWIAKFLLTHDCILGNRCRKFKVTLQGVNFSVYKEGNHAVSSSMHYMSGKPKAVDAFVADLKKDAAVLYLERRGDVFFLLERSESKAVQFHTPKIIFVKPVLIKDDGWEEWEVASWEKEEVSRFVSNVKRHMPKFKLVKFVRTGIETVFFPKLMPDLTEKQKHSIELAIKEGYYSTPRRVDLRKLAKISKISLATYEEHLRKAEEKLIPQLLSRQEQ